MKTGTAAPLHHAQVAWVPFVHVVGAGLLAAMLLAVGEHERVVLLPPDPPLLPHRHTTSRPQTRGRPTPETSWSTRAATVSRAEALVARVEARHAHCCLSSTQVIMQLQPLQPSSPRPPLLKRPSRPSRTPPAAAGSLGVGWGESSSSVAIASLRGGVGVRGGPVARASHRGPEEQQEQGSSSWCSAAR